MAAEKSLKKVIVVIGATGAQGAPVIEHLLKPDASTGEPSPYSIRALTRNPAHRRAKALEEKGVQLFEGSFTDPKAIAQILDGDVYGIFCNTDGFTVGAAAELHAAFEIWEIAQHKRLKHFVWSGLDYHQNLGDYDPQYTCDHYNAKGRFNDYLLSTADRAKSRSGMVSTVLTTGPYMEMLNIVFAPLKTNEKGEKLFVAPTGTEGRIPLVALDDIGWFARYIFDHPSETHRRELRLASDPITIPQIAETFTRVTGTKAEARLMSVDEYFDLYEHGGQVRVADRVEGGTTFRTNFSGFFRAFRDNICPRDMDEIRKIKPDTWTVERWMKEKDYKGAYTPWILKNIEDRHHAAMRDKQKIDAIVF